MGAEPDGGREGGVKWVDSGRIFHKSQWDWPNVWGRAGLKGIRMPSILDLSICEDKRGRHGDPAGAGQPPEGGGAEEAWCGPPAVVGVMGPVSLGCTQASALGKAHSCLSLRTNSAQLYLWGRMGLGLGLCQLQALLGLLGQKLRDLWKPPLEDIGGSWFADQEAEAQRG